MANFSSVGDWSTVAGSNGTIDGNNITENCPMSSLNNGERSIMAAMKGQVTFIATADTSDAYTASPAPTPDALATDVLYCVTFGTANTTTTPTLALATIAAEGAKNIVGIDGGSLGAGALHGRHLLAYDGTSYRCLNPLSLGTNTVTNANLAQMAAHTIKGNNTSGTANAADLTIAQLIAQFTAPTSQAFTSGSAATYTTPAGAVRLRIRQRGGGGGGGAANGGTGTTGSTSSFNSVTAVGGAGGTFSSGSGAAGGAGGTGGSGATLLRLAGAPGQSATNATGNGMGGSGGGDGAGSAPTITTAGNAAVANTGGGGGGASGGAQGGGGGGGQGEYVEFIILSPGATYTYTVGAGGGGASGTTAGGNGAAGYILVEEFYY